MLIPQIPMRKSFGSQVPFVSTALSGADRSVIGLVPRSRLQSADPSVWISSGRIAPGPFEVGLNAQEVLIWEASGASRLCSR
jgi:hypothetical protein